MPTLGISGQEKVSPCLALQAVSQGSVPHAVIFPEDAEHSTFIISILQHPVFSTQLLNSNLL
jgi:hypothetical protein